MDADRIEDLLATLTETARRADFAALAELAEGISAALAAPGPHPTVERAERLRAAAARAAALLNAARDGILAGRTRAAEIRRALDGTATYDPAGNRAVLASAGAALRRT